MNNLKPSRGEVWFVNLDPTVGHEQAKTRPCLVISNNIFNHGHANLHIVLPITSKNKNHPFHIVLDLYEGGLEKESFILCDQIRTVSRQRFKGKSFGNVTEETLASVEYIMGILLNI
ncbi:MAG TPA: type II toxin-antitoxin system PemK/MazF family toxin [Candidatus Babeliales bacterium]|nr:type II toxin-antitoxin system PemK/MazF family toxin [Candidatus Babeliales bacterium]